MWWKRTGLLLSAYTDGITVASTVFFTNYLYVTYHDIVCAGSDIRQVNGDYIEIQSWGSGHSMVFCIALPVMEKAGQGQVCDHTF